MSKNSDSMVTEQSNFKAKGLAKSSYLAERLTPYRSHSLYLHMSDLLLALEKYLFGGEYKIVLDYGAGGSPYKQRIKCQQYLRADIPGDPLLDMVIPSSGILEWPSDSVDMILSTQVLEHVQDVHTYLSEAFRLLAPGGRIFCSTHGMYEEHGCPYDFRRWTLDGLKAELTAVGFVIEEGVKLTSGLRALTLHVTRSLRSPNGLWSVPIFLIRAFLRVVRTPLHWLLDVTDKSSRIGPADATWYANLLVIAVKPQIGK